MKRIIIILSAILVLSAFASSSFAETTARDAMIAYSGTEAFTRLTPEERQACTSWLVYGGEMNDDCKKAVTKLITDAPDAVTPEQRQALLAAASGNTDTVASAPEPEVPAPPAPEPETGSPSQTVKKSDATGKIIAAGLIGVLAGMIIHNNRPGRHHISEPAQVQPEISLPSFGADSRNFRNAPPAPPRMPPRRRPHPHNN